VIDLHSHLLPGVDDGSRSVEQSVRVLERLAADGLTGICLTPHVLASQASLGIPDSHHRAFEALRPAAPAEVTLYRGAEVMLDRPLEAQVADSRLLTLNGTRYILVEFSRLVAAQTVEHALSNVLAIGLVPVLAHPERYKCCRPEAVRRWKALGAIMQVDGPTLLSSRSRGVRARELVEFGLADIAAGDNHGDDRSLGPVWQAFLAQDGAVQAQLLCRKNPQAIIEDRSLDPVGPLPWRVSVRDRLRTLFGRHRDIERG
jgi:protein-tyrosine phosphatase